MNKNQPALDCARLRTCLVKLPELLFKLLQTFGNGVALGDGHACDRQTPRSEDEVETHKRKASGDL